MALEEGELRIVLRVLGDELLKGMADLRTSVTQATDQVAGSFKHAETAVTQSMGTIRERVSVGLSGVSGSIRAFGEYAAIAFGVLAGERAFANVLRSTQEWAFEVEHLAKSLGVTTEEASVYAVAAKEAGLGTEAFDRVARGLIRTLLSKGEGPFHNIGVEAKNADGSLRPLPALLTDVLNAVDGYKGGIDRLAAAQSVFGARVQPETLDGLRRWVEALPHATEVAHALGVVLSEEGVAAAREYQRATADLSLVALGFKETIATALRPQLEALIEQVVQLGRDGTLKQWAEGGAAGIQAAGEAMVILGKAVRDHLDGIKGIAAALLGWEGAKALIPIVTELGTAFRALAVALGLVSVAEDAASFGLTAVIKLVVAASIGLITYEEAWGKVGRAVGLIIEALSGPGGLAHAWAQVTGAADAAAAAEARAGRFRPLSAHEETGGVLPPEEREPPSDRDASGKRILPGEKTFGGTAEARAKAEKAAYDDLMHRQEADLKFFEHNEAAKLEVVQAYSAAIGRLQGLTGAQWEAQQAKETEQKNKAANQQRQIDDLTVAHDVKNATKRLEEDAKVVETRRKLGLISVADAVAVETDLENRRFVIIQTGLQQRLDLLAQDPNSDPVAKVKVSLDLEDAEREHQDRLTEILRKGDADRLAEQKENAKVLGELFAGLGGAFNTALESVVDGTRSRAEVMRSIWQGLLKDVLKIAEEIAATFAKQQAVGALTGTATKATGGTLNEQFSGAVIGGVGKLFGGGGAPGAADPRVATEQQTQAQLTNLTQHGLLARFAITAAHYAKVGALAVLHFVQERAREAAALAKWIATQGIKLAIHIATETGITAVSVAESAVRHAKDIAQVIKSIIAYAYKAAAGAAAAVADIPYAGPILAVVNYGIVLGTVLGGAAAVSAEGGADLPSGGPFSATLHSKELVLPQEHAETIRGLATVVRDLVSGRSGGGGSRVTVGGPELSLASVHASPAVARGVATLHAALTGAGPSAAGGGGDLHIHYSALDLPSGREALRRHAETIHQIVARQSSKQGGGRRHP